MQHSRNTLYHIKKNRYEKNKRLIILFILTGLLVIVSCKKEIFPGNSDIEGNWIEKTSST